MSYLALLLGDSSSGKSTSIVPSKELGIEGLPPKSTGIIDVLGKGLPVKNWKKAYNKENKNYFVTRNPREIKDALGLYKNSPNIKYIIIDDYQYIAAGQFKDDIANKNAGGNAVFERYNNLFLLNYNFFELCSNLREDQIVILISHSERIMSKDGLDVKEVMKTIGKATANHMNPEGMTNVVLFAVSEMKNDKPHKYFLTQTDGEKMARSPQGMFEEMKIKNDLGIVVKNIEPFM